MSLAVFAGKGDLPKHIIESCYRSKKSVVVVGFEGQTTGSLVENFKIPFKMFPIGKIGGILSFLKKHCVKEIVLAGALDRPNFKELTIDRIGLNWMMRLGGKLFKGDNSLLTSIVSLLEKEGFKILSPSDVLGGILAARGFLTEKKPTRDDLCDIRYGIKILDTLSKFDIGQSVIVENGVVLGIEAIEGTERLIKRCAPLKRQKKGGVLIKMAKKGQSDKVDLPTIGLNTIDQVTESGLFGIAIGAGSTQIIDYNNTLKKAERNNIFIVSINN
ncbi:MAG: LpxI family protein [Alphaproteobacteria bacterium]